MTQYTDEEILAWMDSVLNRHSVITPCTDRDMILSLRNRIAPQKSLGQVLYESFGNKNWGDDYCNKYKWEENAQAVIAEYEARK